MSFGSALAGKIRDTAYALVVAPGGRGVHLEIQAFFAAGFYTAHGSSPGAFYLPEIVVYFGVEAVHADARAGQASSF